MNAQGFLEKHGKEVCTKVAVMAGTNWPYFSQIAYGHRRPSVDLAGELVVASEKLIANPDDRLDLVSLLSAKKKRAAA